MNKGNEKVGEGDSDVYELDPEAEDSGETEEIMREAVKAVEAGLDVTDGSGDLEASQEEVDHPEGDESSETLQDELEEMRETALRALADYENYRRRVERERQETRKFALLEPLRDFLPILDNLERAVSAEGSGDDLRVGVELIHRQMLDLLRRFSVDVIEAEGQLFDPAVHEAVISEADEAVAEPTVVQELQRGYSLHGRLLRPAIVKVAMPATRSDASDSEADQSDAVEGE